MHVFAKCKKETVAVFQHNQIKLGAGKLGSKIGVANFGVRPCIKNQSKLNIKRAGVFPEERAMGGVRITNSPQQHLATGVPVTEGLPERS